MSVILRDDVLEYIVQRTPKVFLQKCIEEMEAAFVTAHHDALRRCENGKTASRIRGQMRFYYQNVAFRKAAVATGVGSEVEQTAPPGEWFPLAWADKILYGRTGIRVDQKMRFAKYRSELAKRNARLEPATGELFSEPLRLRPPNDGLGVLIVTMQPPPGVDQERPLGYYLGVPYTSCDGWHLLMPVESALAAYHEPVVQTVPDLAWARLKVKLLDSEK